MELVVLASGSSGNAVLVRGRDRSAVLVDAGVSALQVRRRLETFGHALAEVDALVLTHEHSDHVRGAEVLLRRRPMPVLATAGTWSRIDLCTADGGELSSGRELRVGSLTLLPIATSHDAAEPIALVVDDGEHRLGLCTDTGVFTALLEERLRGCDLLLLEANHDADLLRHGPYPWPLKQRIASRLGHLANHQSEEAIERLRAPGLRAVVGLHLSAENNRPELAEESLRRATGAGPAVTAVPRTAMLRLTLDGDGLGLESHPLPPSGRR